MRLTNYYFRLSSPMNKPLRIHHSQFANIYFASDFHYNHQRDFLWGPRGFKSYKEHDAFIEAQVDTLTENDLLIYLGDYSLNTTDEQTAALLARTKAKIFYVFGNHEGYHSRFYRKSFDKFAAKIPCSSLFQIFPFSVDKTNGEGCAGFENDPRTISYFGEEAYFSIGHTHYFCRHMAPLIWDKMKDKSFVAICGHSHGNLNVGKPDTLDGGKILDIGVDNALKYNGTAFFTVQEVNTIMSQKQIKIFDHHGDDNV